MNATLLARFRSPDPGFDQLQHLDSETLQTWIRDIESERGWEQDQALVTARTKIGAELRQRQAQEAEAEREAILCPSTPGRPPKYVSVDERRLAIREQNRAAVTRFRAKQVGKALPTLPAELWQKFVSACSDRGLDPITEFTRRCLDEPSSAVDFGAPEPPTREPSAVEF